MRRILTFIGVALIVGVPLIALPARAQFGSGIVYDPANYVQNALQAVRSLQEIEAQIQQLAHEIAMLETMARNLETLPASIGSDIDIRIARIEALMRQADGIGYDPATLQTLFDNLYPESYGPTPPTAAALLQHADSRRRQARAAIADSLTVSAEIVSGGPADRQSLDTALSGSQSAGGNLQALQAGNQIGAVQASQLMQLQALIAAGQRAEALESAGDLAEAERGRARTQSFLKE